MIYKVDTTDGTVIGTYQAPGVVPGSRFQQGLACDGFFLWSTVGGSAQMIYQIDIGLTGIKEHREKSGSIKDVRLVVSPNLFIDKARILLALDVPKNVKLSVIDVSGSLVATIIDRKFLSPGVYNYEWQPVSGNVGVYFILLDADNWIMSNKVVHIRR